MQITITRATLAKVGKFVSVIALVAVAVVLLKDATDDALPGRLEHSKYVAVTLDSGEVYFGALQPAQNGFFELRKAHGIARDAATEGDRATGKIAPVTQDAIEPGSSVFIPADDISLVQPLPKASIVAKVIDGKGDYTASGSQYGLAEGSVSKGPTPAGPRGRGNPG